MSETAANPIIEMRNISKTYARSANPALSGVDISISSGENVGLIGANGSGKTTLLRLLMNLIFPDTGEIRVLGERDLEMALQHIGFVPERQQGMENFTPRELFIIAARMNGMDAGEARKRSSEMLQFAGLETVADNLLSDFSKGMVQRVQISMALVHRPKILLLDEPMSGLDPGGQRDIREFLQRLEDLTMIFASHHLDQIETFCSSVIIIDKGRLIRKLDLSGINEEIFTIDLNPEAGKLVTQYKELPIELIDQTENRLRIRFTASADAAQKFISHLNGSELPIHKLRSQSILEDLYHRYVKNKQSA